MSGICGICEPGRAVNSAKVKAMLSALALPGESQWETQGGQSATMCVSRRWDFQQVAAIPGIQIAADAELFNRLELAESLAEKGFDPAKLTPAELLARLYRERGISFVNLLDGVFSFALWDEVHQRMLLGIDRLGINSLYWRKESDSLLFGSRVGALREVQVAPPEVNLVALVQYMLLSAVPAPRPESAACVLN